MNDLNIIDVEKEEADIAIFDVTTSEIAKLKKTYENVPDASTPDNYEFVKKGVNTLTKLRTSVEKRRKSLKDPYIKAGKMIDAKAKQITESLVEIEEPLKAEKKRIDDEEKRKKEERIKRLQSKIDAMEAFIDMSMNADSSTISEYIETVSDIDTANDFYDLTEAATKMQASVVQRLGDMLTQRITFEQAEADRIAAEEKQREMEEQKKEMERQQYVDAKINSLRMIPVELMDTDAPAREIMDRISKLKVYKPEASTFGDRIDEVEQLLVKVISNLDKMHKQACMIEQEELLNETNETPVLESVEKKIGVNSSIDFDESALKDELDNKDMLSEAEILSSDKVVEAVEIVNSDDFSTTSLSKIFGCYDLAPGIYEVSIKRV